MEKIPIREFRSKLSHYMERMRMGERIRVRDMVICAEEVVMEAGSQLEELDRRVSKLEEFISDNRY